MYGYACCVQLLVIKTRASGRARLPQIFILPRILHLHVLCQTTKLLANTLCACGLLKMYGESFWDDTILSYMMLPFQKMF